MFRCVTFIRQAILNGQDCFIRNGFASIRNVLFAFAWMNVSKSYECLTITVERSSSVVECRTRNRESPGSNPPLLPFRRLGIFRSLHRRPCSLSCINEYLAIDSGGNVSDLVLARNCCLARMLPGEAENGVGMNRSVREGKKWEAL